MPKKQRERDFREYDAQITIRICEKFYKLCCLFNRYNVCNFIRKLIRADLTNDYFLSIDLKDHYRLDKVFDVKDYTDIKRYTFNAKKTRKITIRLYINEKLELKRRSEGNVSKYIHYMFMGFIENIIDDIENMKGA